MRHSSSESANTQLFKVAYGTYWDIVKNSLDECGWCYANDVPHLTDAYFEHNTGKDIQFEKSYPGAYKGYRWRPKELATNQTH
ncbi:hypothetical protein [Spirosoma foliorum]|uniref:Uncharacterized protein n=1 Tax=Spirosoma foliorum TaxID=2710596 RepID=A0A7G5H2N5_9BACT|nr:hypothetical protein [Spirosoma foliorum]QMW05377.1 hypothetical protein H3H32_11030 [Spirosoma foliorum]